ncbi:Na/Pi cotransporter family protein [Haloferula sp. A504]|uniref:Na/Pi cotransporter family protein n=1 Tax=Haloferula sp. A504 TaxID=3373601 RepID=UPI0031C7537D|nr:Na/Pi symporter [Verrucomicrobiaceae bacterium E54]
MFRKIILTTVFAALAYGFWASPNFKEIAAGVAIFLFGMLALEEGFRAFTGGVLERLLRRTTDKLWKSLSFGVISTTLMQSSSLVSVITISFLSAGLITLTAGIGIIFGANLGTTTGAWLVAGFGLKVNIAAYAMPMLVFGTILIFQKARSTKGFGYILAGLGFLFLGIHYMKEGFEAYRHSLDLTRFAVGGYPGLFLFALIGLVATVVMQSSHATLVLIITALAAQQITYENALALAIGANVGTTITAIIGALGSNVNGRRLAGAHLVFNLVTGLVAIGLIHQLTAAVDATSAWLGIADDDHTLKLAVFHTLFNALGIVLMLPLLKPMVWSLEQCIKPRARTAAQPRYLHTSATELPDTAIEAVRLETLHLYDNASDIIARALGLRLDDILSGKPIDEVVDVPAGTGHFDIDEAYRENVKGLFAGIVEFISRAQADMTPEQHDELFALRAAGRDIVEAIKDTKHLRKNLSRFLVSDDAVIRGEYAGIRRNLATVLRSLDEVRDRGHDSAAILSLDLLKARLKQYDRELGQRLNDLIQQRKVSGPVTISLMNDSGYAYQVTKNLVKMGAILFSTADHGLREAERSISLDESEMAEALGTLPETPTTSSHEPD